MMISMKKLIPLILCCAALPLSAQAPSPAAAPAPAPASVPAVKAANDAKMSVYDKVMAELSKLPHRVPGSPEYNKAVDFMEKTLKDAGIDVHRQTYPTLIPEITKNNCTIDGEKLELYPLAPNNAALMTTGRRPIDAPVIYIPKDELYKDYGRIDGKVVVLDWGENYYPRIFFTEGAKAVIFVGNDIATQWDIAKLQSQYNVAFPYFYITREEALKHHIFYLEKDPTSKKLYDEKKGKQAHIELNTQWKSVNGINLWAKIQGKDVTMNLNAPEAITIGARLDTFGSVPTLVSGDRSTANLALFAETAGYLNEHKADLNRSVFLILYGSSFNAYDGLRYFYFPIYKKDATGKPQIGDYAKGFNQELTDTQKKLDVLTLPSPIRRDKKELSLTMIWAVAGSLLLVFGCVMVGAGIKNKRQNRVIVGAIPTVIGAIVLILYGLGIFDSKASQAEQEEFNQKYDAILAKLNGYGKSLPPLNDQMKIRDELLDSQKLLNSGKVSADEEQALETKINGINAKLDPYYDALNEMDDLLANSSENTNPFYEKDGKDNSETKPYYEVRILLRDAVIKEYNRQNYRLADINVELRKIERDLKQLDEDKPKLEEAIADLKKKPSKDNELRIKKLEKTLAENAAKVEEYKNNRKSLKEERDLLNRTKVSVANMRKNLNERSISKKEDRILLRSFIDQVRGNLEKRKKELQTAIKTAEYWKDIATEAKPYAFVDAFYFDFSNDDQPFFFCTRSYEGLHTWEAISTSTFTKFLKTFGEVYPELKLQKSGTPFFAESLKNANFTPDTMSTLSLPYLPHTASFPLKLNSFTLRNVPGGYDYDEVPGHRTYSLKKLVPAMNELMTVFATDERFSMHSQLADPKMADEQLNYYYDKDGPHGKIFTYLAADGKEIDGPAVGALAIVHTNEYDRIYPICGFANIAMSQINQIGYVSMPLVSLNRSGSWGAGLGIEGGAVSFDEFGYVKYINTQSDYSKLFKAYGGPHVYNYAPLTSNFCGSLDLVNGFTDAKFINYRTNARVATGEGYAYADRDMLAKIYFYNETFILGSTPEDPIGKGISIQPEDLLGLNVSRIAIDNTIQLNEGRLKKLHSRNIYNDVIEQYHDKAVQHQIDAKEALKAGKINLARAHEVFGQTLAVQAYRPLRDTINDLVQSVLILLILTIPFAFALERLLVGSTNIYKQLGWILIFFIGTFLMLYFTHPAFALSQAPMIIFIAFFIIVMSVVVIYIVMNRFKGELLAMQGMDTSAHRVNSENSMLLAAILIGVSSMRNRPVKTFLTILTIILLTFTIISFASFSSTQYVRPVYMGDASGEVRIESFLPQHVDVLMPLCKSIRDLYEKDYNVFYRSASYNSPFYIVATYPMQTNIIYNPDSKQKEKSIKLEAVVGFEAGEAERSAKLKTLMPKPKDIPKGTEQYPGVYISDLTAKKLELNPGDVFYLRNMKVRLDGTFKAADLDSFTYLDNGKAVPPNFEATASAEETHMFSIFNKAYVDASNFIWSSPDLSLLTDYDTATKINGFINAVVLYPKEGKNPDILKDANDIAEVTFGIVYSNTVNGVNRHFMAPVFSASGIGNLIVPLLLGALIILSSLLGSIADREREIFTFSALGLSPKDVSILFFAESGVYAVVGGLGGYLLSQVTNAVMQWCASKGWMEAPEMNFSSMTTVYTILIVMAIVLLSTVYPAIKAGRAASPDVARKWKMPPPDGDNLSFQFPFTVSRIDFGGILVFISEHFANHTDSSLGNFAAANVQIMHGKEGITDGYLLSVDLTLAPFDLGVAENLMMYSAPSDIEGVDVVTVKILRKDGSKGAWLRGNRRFVDEVRNQFLLWRSLPVETVMHYREQASQKLNTTSEEGAKA